MRHVAVLAGGVLGALARWWISAHLLPAARFPFSTLAINASGCFLLGFLFTYLREEAAPPGLRLGVTTGFLGAYTTFSTWQEGVAVLWRGGAPVSALVYLVGSLLAGVLLAGAGMGLAARLRTAAGAGRPGAAHPAAPAALGPAVRRRAPAGGTGHDGGDDVPGGPRGGGSA